MNYYSIKRRHELGPGFKCTPGALAQGLFAWYDQLWPGWRNQMDAQAVELALVDLVGDNNPRRVDPVRLDALAEILTELRSQNPHAIRMLQEAVAQVAASPTLPAIIDGINTYFRVGHPLQDPTIRTTRVQIFSDFFELLEPIFTTVFNRYARKLDTRARDEHKGLVEMTQAEQHPSPATESPIPSEIEDAQGAARRVLLEVEMEVTPAAMKALRIYLTGLDDMNASEASRVAGISPATLTRVLQTLQTISNREIGTHNDTVRLAFAKALRSAAAA